MDQTRVDASGTGGAIHGANSMAVVRTDTSYNRVANALRREILDGVWAAGAQLPTERAMCDQYGASRITIRRALQILEEESLIQRRQGRGTFVSEQPTRKIPLLTSDFFGSMSRHAPEMRRQVITCQWRTVSPPLDEVLSLLPNEKVLYAKRADVLENKAIAWDEIYLTKGTASDITAADLATVDFLYRWQQRGRFELDYMQQTIEVVPADEAAVQLLGVRAGLPLLTTREVAFARTGQVVGYFVAFYPSDLYRLSATVKLTAGGKTNTRVAR